MNFQKNDKNTGKSNDGRLASKNIEHLLSSDQFSAFSKMDVLIPGSRWSPNAVKVKSGKLYGPSWRYIVQMKKDSIHAIGIYPGGQSGNPADENYEKFISSWTKGNYLNLNYTKYEDKDFLKSKHSKSLIIKNEE